MVGWVETLKLTLACEEEESKVLHWSVERNLRLALNQGSFQLDQLSTWMIGTLVMGRALDKKNEWTSTKKHSLNMFRYKTARRSKLVQSTDTQV